jgi:oxalate decarboxylase/phosphoglucose isomerase-like protein (cupin superfamily)
VVQNPGDVVYIPADWYHATMNMEAVTIAVAREMSCSSDPKPVVKWADL